ncbi:MAG TPA: calcium-binding protein [Nocardioidaceae bacterium]|nr:calcium-binding protein [Nocardioidaceae bacterium]
MFRRNARRALAVLVGSAVIAGTAGGQLVAQGEMRAGPPYDFTTEIMTKDVIPLKDAAMIQRSLHGYVYLTGQQDNHLVVTPVEGGLRFADTGTKQWKGLPRACRKKAPRTGIAAVCRIPSGVSERQPLLLEVWPRLGDDYVDGSRLPATVAMSVLGDAGNDVARLGAGPDFFNGAFGNDRVWGGAGNDWLRTGEGNDRIRGGPGNDELVGVDGRDIIYGGAGEDRIVGLDGDDKLFSGPGRDLVLCGAGIDSARVDEGDTVRDCEHVERR